MRLQASMAAALRDLAADDPIDLFVSGDCMAPRLRSGDRIRVTPRRVYWPGDIVAFRRSDDDRLLAHRVLGYTLSRRGLRLVAKGDRLSREDNPVALNDVVGRVVTGHDSRLRPSAYERGRALALLGRVLLRRSLSPWASAKNS